MEWEVLAGRAGTRVPWEAVPEAIRASVEQAAGGKVVSTVSQPFGFSPALAARLILDGGGRFFVKAIGPDEETGAPGGQASYRREARVAEALPSAVPAPSLVASWEEAGWVVLLFEDVEGHHPVLPWRSSELDRVLRALEVLAETLTPPPLEVPVLRLPGGARHWVELSERPGSLDRLRGLDPWVGDNLGTLAELASSFENAAAGGTLLHTDLRADNILITDNSVVFVDWPHVAIGAAWVDLAYMLPSVAMQGGPDPEEIFWSHPCGRRAHREAVTSVVAGVAGYFIHGACQPPPPGLPTLRQFQLAQGIEAVRWVRKLTE